MANGRGRKGGFQMGSEHRTKIANSQVLKRLIGHAEGTVDMTATQVTAAISLLDRVMPKLSSVSFEGDPDNPIAIVSRIELVAPKNERSAD